jgi:hypothetical protein
MALAALAPLSYGRGVGVRVRAKRGFAVPVAFPHPTGCAGHLLPEGEGKRRYRTNV